MYEELIHYYFFQVATPLCKYYLLNNCVPFDLKCQVYLILNFPVYLDLSLDFLTMGNFFLNRLSSIRILVVWVKQHIILLAASL